MILINQLTFICIISIIYYFIFPTVYNLNIIYFIIHLLLLIISPRYIKVWFSIVYSLSNNTYSLLLFSIMNVFFEGLMVLFNLKLRFALDLFWFFSLNLSLYLVSKLFTLACCSLLTSVMLTEFLISCLRNANTNFRCLSIKCVCHYNITLRSVNHNSFIHIF